jgi:hypothetical protein
MLAAVIIWGFQGYPEEINNREDARVKLRRFPLLFSRRGATALAVVGWLIVKTAPS